MSEPMMDRGQHGAAHELFSNYAEEGAHATGATTLPGGAAVQTVHHDADRVTGALTSMGIGLSARSGRAGRLGPDFDAWLRERITAILVDGALNEEIHERLSEDGQVWKVAVEFRLADDQEIGHGTGESSSSTRAGRDRSTSDEHGSTDEVSVNVRGAHGGVTAKHQEREGHRVGAGQQHETEKGDRMCTRKTAHRARIVAKVRVEVRGMWIDKSSPLWQLDMNAGEVYDLDQKLTLPDIGDIIYATDDNICP